MTQDVTSTQPPEKKPRRKRRWPRVILFIFIILVLGVILTPTVISTSPGKAFLVGRFNARIPGKLQIGEISVGWMSGTTLRGLTLNDQTGKEIFNLRDAKTDMTLLDVVRGQYHLGNANITVDNIAIERDASGMTNLQRALGNEKSEKKVTSSTTESAENQNEQTANKLIDAAGHIALTINRASWRDEKATISADATSANISFDTAGLPATVEFSTTLNTSDHASSQIALHGTADLFHRQRIRPIHEMKLQGSAIIKGLDVGSLKGMLTSLGATATADGQLDATLNFDTTQTTTVARGEIRLKDFAMSGQSIKGGTLALGSISVPMDVQLQSDGLKVRKLDVIIAPTPDDLIKNPDLALRITRNSILNWTGGENRAFVDIEYDLARLVTLFKSHMPADTHVAGRYTTEVRIIGPLTNENGLAKIRQLEIAPVKFGFDSVKTNGFDLGKSEIVLSLIDGIVKIGPSRVSANGGELNLDGRIRLLSTPIMYELDSPLPLAKGVQMNKQIAAGPLAFLPIAWGLDENKMHLLDARGSLNITLSNAKIPLTWNDIQKQGTASGTLGIDAFTSNSPIFNEVLKTLGPIAKITQTNWVLPEQNIRDIAFALNAGRVSYKDFTIKAGSASFDFAGQAGLDKTLDMTLNVTESRLNLAVPVTIRGTASKPHISVSPNAIQKTIQQSAPALIENLLDRRKRDNDKK